MRNTKQCSLYYVCICLINNDTVVFVSLPMIALLLFQNVVICRTICFHYAHTAIVSHYGGVASHLFTIDFSYLCARCWIQ